MARPSLWSILLISMSALGGCDDGDPSESTCASIEGRTFRSVEERECGLGFEGVVYCRWSITFSGDQYEWSYSDVVESGRFSCSGDEVIGTAFSGEHRGTFDAETDRLLWEEMAYTPD